MNKEKFSCIICKRLADKEHKKGYVSKYLLSSMIWFDNEEEAINHLKKVHPNEYQKYLIEKENGNGGKDDNN